jgi:hypothetical protein
MGHAIPGGGAEVAVEAVPRETSYEAGASTIDEGKGVFAKMLTGPAPLFTDCPDEC